jgi:pilus assembly protein Flp/PilA
MTRTRVERGASAVEYGLLMAGIAAVIAIAVYSFGGTVRSALFETSCSTINSAVHASTTC